MLFVTTICYSYVLLCVTIICIHSYMLLLSFHVAMYSHHDFDTCYYRAELALEQSDITVAPPERPCSIGVHFLATKPSQHTARARRSDVAGTYIDCHICLANNLT